MGKKVVVRSLLALALATVTLTFVAKGVVARPTGQPTMPSVEGGTVWSGAKGVYQVWDDGSWVYVWQPRDGEPAPASRWPDRTLTDDHILFFANRRWDGGYLSAVGRGDRVLVAQDGAGEWHMALYVPSSEVVEARADSIVQALKTLDLPPTGAER